MVRPVVHQQPLRGGQSRNQRHDDSQQTTQRTRHGMFPQETEQKRSRSAPSGPAPDAFSPDTTDSPAPMTSRHARKFPQTPTPES